MPYISEYMNMRKTKQRLGEDTEVVFKYSSLPIYIRKAGQAVQVVLAHTPIVTFTKNNNIRLRTGGWKTVTTKLRINQFISEHGYTLYQEDGEWYLWDRCTGLTVDFVDGMELAP